MNPSSLFEGYLIGEEVLNLSDSVKMESSNSPIFDDIPLNQGELFSDLPGKKGKSEKVETEKPTGSSSDGYKQTSEYKNLEERASRAQLMKHIQGDELNRLKIEAEIVNFKKIAGEVAEFKFMEMMYLSYLEKMHKDSIGMVKRLMPKIESYVRDPEIVAAIKLMLKKEISKTLAGVKMSQIKEVEKWNNV